MPTHLKPKWQVFIPHLTPRGSQGECSLTGKMSAYLTGFLFPVENVQGTPTHVSSTFLRSPKVTNIGYEEKELCTRVVNRSQLAAAQIHWVTKSTLVFLCLEISMVATILGNLRKRRVEWGFVDPPNVLGYSQPQYYWHLDASLLGGTVGGRVCPTHCRTFSSIPGPYVLDAGGSHPQLWQPNMSADIANSPQHPVEKHCMKVSYPTPSAVHLIL